MSFDSLENISKNSVYYDYIQLGSASYIEKVRFYESNLNEIQNLEFEYRLTIWYDYARAVFEIGRYSEFIRLSDQLIPIVIAENIISLNETDPFKELLFRKGASHFNLHNYKEADYIFSELMKIDSSSDLYVKARKQSLYKVSKKDYLGLQALSILFFIVTAIIIAIELLIVKSFYPIYSEAFENVRIGTFLCGIGTILLMELLIRYKNSNIINDTIKKV